MSWAGVLFSLGFFLARSAFEGQQNEWWNSEAAYVGQMGLAVAGSAAMFASLRMLSKQGYGAAMGWMLLAATCFGGWTVILAPGGDAVGI